MKTPKEAIQEVLRKGECEVIFRKKNGDEREMVCTLHPDYLPQDLDGHVESGASKSNATEDNVVVWDIEADARRSFRIDSIISGPTHVG